MCLWIEIGCQGWRKQSGFMRTIVSWDDNDIVILAFDKTVALVDYLRKSEGLGDSNVAGIDWRCQDECYRDDNAKPHISSEDYKKMFDLPTKCYVKHLCKLTSLKWPTERSTKQTIENPWRRTSSRTCTSLIKDTSSEWKAHFSTNSFCSLLPCSQCP